MSGDPFAVAAEAYDSHVGRYTPALAQAFVEFVGVEPGARALDVGCGPGALTAVLARRLGPERVSAVEPSEPFAEACRARNPGVEVAVGAAEAIPFGDGSFDVALAQLVVNFMRDAEQGVRELRRVTRPGGAVAACVWDYADGMTLLRVFWEAAREVAADRGAGLDEGARMLWCRDGELADLLARAGLHEIRRATLEVRVRYASFEELWAPLLTGVAPSGAFCVSLDATRRAALHDAYRRRLGVGDGPFELTARAWAAAGTV